MYIHNNTQKTGETAEGQGQGQLNTWKNKKNRLGAGGHTKQIQRETGRSVLGDTTRLDQVTPKHTQAHTMRSQTRFNQAQPCCPGRDWPVRGGLLPTLPHERHVARRRGVLVRDWRPVTVQCNTLIIMYIHTTLWTRGQCYSVLLTFHRPEGSATST